MFTNTEIDNKEKILSLNLLSIVMELTVMTSVLRSVMLILNKKLHSAENGV